MRSFLNLNIAAARVINQRLPEDYRTDGNFWFQKNVLKNGFRDGDVVYDVGGGSRPWFTVEQARALNLTVIGVDISGDELRAAPEGSYDEIIEADLCEFSNDRKADRIICQATLEHVHDSAGAIRSISGLLKPGGEAFTFCPCRNALFARLNRRLGHDVKKKLLGAAFPYTEEGHDGFAAPYDKCTPGDMRRLAEENGLSVAFLKTFWVSGYFYVFLPAYLGWRVYQLVARAVQGEDACESFCMILRKR
ncbi:class I SAM-dependent methyltransferase [Hansschlegelia plantiphila]|uniref:Class I SAM-dependent methyltransferase n=1 Tax=Hansschlegelia plantiphila TaxID=374655 RepID=A0A9W6MX48_9HYPH|nr:methyltransferase domain-containing protein [Hansschlegelia plantiphila]GLK69703.1 hypothetical protein GCM10008179_33410 [Hansschlegelia plantiphila]